MAQSLSNLPIGSQIKFGKYSVNEEPAQDIVWEIAAKGHQCEPAYPSNSITLFSKYILDLRAFDSRENILPGYATLNVSQYGYNKYGESNIDQWLNSDADAGAWYMPQHEGDCPPTAGNIYNTPSEYDMRPGFLNAFTEDEKNALLDTTIRCVNGRTAAEADNSSASLTYYDIVRKVFLPSLAESGISNYHKEGSAFYGYGSELRAMYSPQFLAYSPVSSSVSPSEYGTYWFRTVQPTNNYDVAYKTNLTANSNNHYWAANGNVGVRPVINLPISIVVSDTTDSDGCYTVVWNNAPNAPTSLNVPTIYGGRGNTISWSASSDPDGDSVSYQLECSVDGGAFTRIYSGTSLSYTHTLASGATTIQYRVRAVDSKGAAGAYTTSQSITVTNNRAPVISGNDSNLGTIVNGISLSYTVTDEDGDTVEVVEKLDGTVFRTYTVTLGSTNTCSINGVDWLKVLNGTHTLMIIATDSKGVSCTRTHTFTKNVTTMSIITDPMDSSTKPQRIVFTVSRVIPLGAIFKVEVCNNGNDASPTWEDATTFAEGTTAYTFTNAQKTANSWAVRIRVTVDRNGATGSCYISGIGGNFE